MNFLLEGPAGTGKTHSIGTLVDAGVEVFFFSLESGMESLLGYYTDRSKPIPENLHWHSLQLVEAGGFIAMAKAAGLIASMTYEGVTKIQDMERHLRNPYERMLKVLADFEDQKTGKKYGSVDSWGPDRALVLDGTTGLARFAIAMQVGAKPVMSQPDYQVVQQQMERFMRYMCDGCKCHFIMISHIEKELDQVLGGIKLYPSTPGQKLSPKMPQMFSDVVLAERNGNEFSWNTNSVQADLKTRNLPLAGKITPDFRQVIDKWKSRGGRFSPLVKT